MGVMGDPGASSLYIFLDEISPSHRTDFQFLSPMQARHWSQTPAFYCVSSFSVHKTSIYFSPSKPSPLQGICSIPSKSVSTCATWLEAAHWLSFQFTLCLAVTYKC